MNQTRKTLETDESEARDLESENLKFVECGVQFVRKIRKIRLQISGVGRDIPTMSGVVPLVPVLGI